MVMHARKPQRINDGYFDKHQTHPYQNSKYSSSKGSYASGDRYDRIRDSPNGNYRSDSPDSQSPRDRDRLYQSKGSYLHKIREKERENRDYKIPCDKYSDCSRSPKEKRLRDCRDSEHRTNHDRSGEDKSVLNSLKISSHNSSRDRKPVHNCQDKREERERIARVGDWSEHISSSGKKYYYNCKTEVSQWEKPREWIEKERDKYRSKDRDSDRSYSSSRSSGHDKHSSSGRASASNKSDSRSSRHWSRDEPPDHPDRRKYSVDESQLAAQDMDISPGDSTPTSERDPPSAVGGETPGAACASGRASSVTPATPVAHQQGSPGAQLAAPLGANAPGPPVALAATLPRILSQIASTTLSHSHAVNPMDGSIQQSPASVLQPLKVDTNHAPAVGGNSGDGPPTPTHSEHQDCLDPRKQHHAVRTSPPPSSSLPSLQGVSSSLSALRPQGPSITPSLANHYRDDLVNHVRGWPADILEKQAQKLAEEAHILGSLQCTKVSAELKSARSIVRLTEIQATLHEQRILFLRQQIKALEELKSQNSFMSDGL